MKTRTNFTHRVDKDFSAEQRRVMGRAGFRSPALTIWPFDSPAKLRRSVPVPVAVAAPIEQVVDPHLHHLDVAVALGESVAGEEWGDPSRNNKCPIIQPKIVILDLRRPIGRKSPFDARASE